MDTTRGGDALLRIVWEGSRHPRDVRPLLEQAIETYLQDLIPDDYDLTPLPQKGLD